MFSPIQIQYKCNTFLSNRELWKDNEKENQPWRRVIFVKQTCTLEQKNSDLMRDNAAKYEGHMTADWVSCQNSWWSANDDRTYSVKTKPTKKLEKIAVINIENSPLNKCVVDHS